MHCMPPFSLFLQTPSLPRECPELLSLSVTACVSKYTRSSRAERDGCLSTMCASFSTVAHSHPATHSHSLASGASCHGSQSLCVSLTLESACERRRGRQDGQTGTERQGDRSCRGNHEKRAKRENLSRLRVSHSHRREARDNKGDDDDEGPKKKEEGGLHSLLFSQDSLERIRAGRGRKGVKGRQSKKKCTEILSPVLLPLSLPLLPEPVDGPALVPHSRIISRCSCCLTLSLSLDADLQGEALTGTHTRAGKQSHSYRRRREA